MIALPTHNLAGAFKALCFALIIGLLGILASSTQFSLSMQERIGLQLLFTLRGALKPPPEAVIVAIDRQSARRLNLPLEIEKWPRDLHARAVERLIAEGAAVIVFDLIFSDPQTSEADQRLAQAMRRAKNVVLAQALMQERLPLADQKGRKTGFISIEKVAPPIAPLAEAALAQAPFPLPKIPIYLTQYWTFKFSAGDIPTLPVVVFHAYAGQAYADFIHLLQRKSPGHASILPTPSGAGYTLEQILGATAVLRSIFERQPDLGRQMRNELDHRPRFQSAPRTTQQVKSLIDLYQPCASRYLNFYGPAATIRTIPYYRLMEPSPPSPAGLDLRGKVVFIGETESGSWPQARDGFYTVYSKANGADISGVEIAASAFANLAENRGVTPPDWPVYLGIILTWGAAVALIAITLHAAAALAALMALGGLYLWVATAQFAASGLWLPIAVPLAIQMPLAYLSALGYKYCRLKGERQNIRAAFGHYLPNPVVDKLTRNINYLHDGGQILYGICLFTDAEKYTCLSENMDPKELTCLMNQYYRAIFEPVKAHDGLVLQVVGDSVLSIWTAQHPDVVLKVKACKAALGIDASVRQFNLKAADFQLPTRIGMHAGYMLLGNVGAMDHFEYRPVGDIVNTASRLEGLNKYLGTRLLISEEIHQDLQGFLTRCMGKFIFIGKSRPNLVYELVCGADSTDAQREGAYRHFGIALEAFHKQCWDTARESFHQVLNLIGPDEPSKFYLRLCDAYCQSPPEADWDGTIYLKQK
jgi:adenylate cyclase